MKDLFTFLPVKPEDIPTLCSFPQTAEELFFMFPKARFPLTVDQLEASINSRFDSSVVCYKNQPVAFANFYEMVMDHYCSIGNVIVDPTKRGMGIGKFLLDQMMELAVLKYNIKEMRLTCFNTNTNALLFYTNYGFIPYDIKSRENHLGKTIASIHMKYLRGNG
jgi:ribosomal protein S18 acetylase RimI-like enzyme